MNPQFASLVLGIGQQAGAALEGTLPDAMSGAGTPREVAKALIDTLVMLEEKTKGHLEADEERLLSETLTALRFQFLRSTS